MRLILMRRSLQLIICIIAGCLFVLVVLRNDDRWSSALPSVSLRSRPRLGSNSAAAEEDAAVAWSLETKSVDGFEDAAPTANAAQRHSSSHRNTIVDGHVRAYENPLARKRTYPQRLNMGACPPIYGRIGVFVAYVKSSYETYVTKFTSKKHFSSKILFYFFSHYHVAQETLKCWLKSTNYTLALVDLFNDERVNAACKHDQVRCVSNCSVSMALMFSNRLLTAFSLKLFFKKHCAASVYLADFDWMLILGLFVNFFELFKRVISTVYVCKYASLYLFSDADNGRRQSKSLH